MLMAYLGALKTWIYAVVFRLFAPSYISIRMPALLMGAISVWILFLLVEQIHSRRAAWIAALVLATDPMFILTTTFDWGPVALQHLLTISGIYFVLRFHQHARSGDLALACFCFGLGFWDKALFIWMFGGLSVALLLVCYRELWQALSAKNVVIAVVAFCAGAAPLIAFNVTSNFRTFHSTAGFSTREFPTKVALLLSTSDGSALFGYLAFMDYVKPARTPGNVLEQTSFALHGLAGTRLHDGLFLAALLSLLLLPFLWRKRGFRIGVFCAVAFAVGWLQMAITREAGAAAHHVVLLWPLPMVLVAVVVAEVAQSWGKIGRVAAGSAVVFLLVSNLLVVNQYFYQLARNGSPGSWTDGIFSLAKGLAHTQASRIAVIDWGITMPLDVLDRGRLPLVWSYDVDSRGDTTLLKDPHVLWLSHTDGNEQFRGTNGKLAAFARAQGFKEEPVALYYDRNGRAVFQTFRMVKE